MTQKLSAWNYIKNNRRRVSVLVVSLTLGFVLLYVTQLLLSAVVEADSLCVLFAQKVQYVRLSTETLGLGDSFAESDEELESLHMEYRAKQLALADRLRAVDGVKAVWYTQRINIAINCGTGTAYSTCPLLERDEIPVYLEHMGVALAEGRLPEQPGEVVIDRLLLRNTKSELNGILQEDWFGEDFTVVGVLDTEQYLACGIPTEHRDYTSLLTVLSDGSIEDMSAVLLELGITVVPGRDQVFDYRFAEEEARDTAESIGRSISLMKIAVLVCLFLALFIVYTTYLRDRHQEWCLYCSIGYSRKIIYAAIVRELLFTFALAILLSSVLSAVLAILLDCMLLQPMGLLCRRFNAEAIGEILCAFTLFFGILQIPVRFALYRIRTIDAMEDDLY